MAASGTFSRTWASGTWAGKAKNYNWTGNWARSGNTISLTNMKIWMSMVNSSHTGTGSGTDTITVSPGGSAQSVTFTWSGGNASNVRTLNNVSFTVSGTATSQTLSCIITGENTGTVSISFDGVPNTPTISESFSNSTQNNITYGTTSFNGGTSGTVYLYGGTSTAPTTQINSKTTTGDTTYQHTGLTRNTRYYYRARAKNSMGWSSYSTEISGVTGAGAKSWSVSSYSTTSIVISYTTAVGGGVYAQQMQYSLDNGSTWTTGATVPAGTTAETTGTFTISRLTAGTTYSIRTRVLTTAGSASGTTITQTTAAYPSGGTLTVTSKTWNSVTVLGSITSWGYPNTEVTGKNLRSGIRNTVNEAPRKEIRLVNDELSGTGTINNKSSSVDGGFTICGGMAVYPYLWASNTVVSTYVVQSSSSNVVYLPPAPLQVFELVSQEISGNTVTATIRMQGKPANGTDNRTGLTVKNKYRVNTAGSWGSWVTLDSTAVAPNTIKTITLTNLPLDTTIRVQGNQFAIASDGGSEISEITFTTLGRPFYGSVNGQTKRIIKLYGSTAGQDVFPSTFDGATAGHGITFSLNGKVITLNGTNDNTGDSVFYLVRPSRPLTLPAGVYHCSTPGNTSVHITFYDGTNYKQLNNVNNYTMTISATTTYTNVYVEVTNGVQTVFNNFTYTPMLYDDTGHSRLVDKFYGSVNGQSKRIF